MWMPFRRPRPDFVIYAPPFNENVGGYIVLHLLCARLREAGFDARVWPDVKPLLDKRGVALARQVASTVLGRYLDYYNTGPFDNPDAKFLDPHSAITIYPEVIAGNPLKSRKVVRWLLHRPGHHTGVVDYGRDDLLFYYNKAFLDNPDRLAVGGELSLTYVPATYSEAVAPVPREGSCFLLRKGAGRPPVHPAEAIPLDGLNHAAISDVFRRCERLYSYDLYTMYSYFAGLCGCVPIIVPQPGLSETEWQPDERLRYGLAYGEDRIDWAIQTRPLLLERFRSERRREDALLSNFVERCRARFAGR